MALFVEVGMKTELYERSEQYEKIADEVIKEQQSLHWLLSLGVRIAYVESAKPKTNEGKAVLGECIKVEEVYQVFCPYDFIIVIYAPNTYHLTDEQKKILLHHELLHCDFNETKKGTKFKVRPHDIEEFREIIDNHGLDWAR